MADRLIRIAAERALRRGAVLAPPDHHAWEEFCARFPYAETDDQLNAIADVLGDMESGRPMDRLVCGDVGFGKTEVALRAAYVAAMSGMQVAVIAPTTLLARQHFKSFSERFRGLPVRVRQLSRFVAAKEAAETRDGAGGRHGRDRDRHARAAGQEREVPRASGCWSSTRSSISGWRTRSG